jgi:hypothetical protein
MINLWTVLTAVVLASLAAFPAGAAVEADQSLAPQISSDEDPQKKWDRLSREEKKDLIRKYELFKSLPESERKELRERHRKLNALRESLDDMDRGSFDGPPSHDPREREWHSRIRKFLKERLESAKKHLNASGADNGRDRLERIRKFRKKLEHLNHERMDGFLKKVVEEGIISIEEAEKLKAVPHHERKEKLFSLDQERLMQEMKGLLPPGEEDHLKRMEPWRFHRRMQAEQDQWGMVKPASRFGALTPEQEETLKNLPHGPERFRVMRQFIEENLRSRLQRLGVDRETLDKVFSMPPHERQRWIMKKIRSLKEKSGNLPPELRELLHPSWDQRSPDESDAENKRRMKRHRPERRGPGRRL